MQENKVKVLDIKKVLGLVISKWYIIAAMLVISVTIAYLKLRYTAPLYTASINLRIDDERGGQINDFFKYGRVNGRIENVLRTESEIIKSRSMSTKTLLAMNDQFTYTVSGKVLSKRLYPNDLFNLSIYALDSSDFGTSFALVYAKDNKLRLEYDGKKEVIHNNDTIRIGNSLIVISRINNSLLRGYQNSPITVTIDNIVSKSYQCASSINIENVKGTTILTISYTSDVPEYATAFVNTLARVYIKEIVFTKSLVADQTINFIESQLDQLSENVQLSQKNLASFKSKNKGVSPDELGQKEFAQLTKIEAEKNIENIRKKTIQNAINEVKGAENKPVRFITFDIEESATLTDLQKLLNETILDKFGKQQQYTPSSKTLIDYDKKINEIKTALLSALYSALNKSNERLAYFENLQQESSASLMNLPGKQQMLINIERDYKVNEKIFSYLLEKRLETLITKASIIPNASIIDASLSAGKVYPDDSKNYSVAISMAILFSLIIISILRLIYDKIPNKETIEEISNIPVIGLIKKLERPQDSQDYDIYVYHSPKSIFSESIRGIRTNINFFLNGEKHKIISLTSTVSGEGKTFCTLNLAASLTLLGNKVLIIGCDLRRPKIHLSFRNIDNRSGLTSYLYGKHEIHDVIKATEYKDLYVIPAGPVPPNPAELLQSDRLKTALDLLKEEYDYIFLDTAPVGLVSDSFALFSLSDINLYILRAQYSKRDFALIPDRLVKDVNIKNMYSILNSYDNSGSFYSSLYKNEYGGYYGGGGYYYYGGYYGKGSYGYYGRKSDAKFYTGYYAEEDITGPKTSFFENMKRFFKPKSS